jgi:WD40 repeat protein
MDPSPQSRARLLTLLQRSPEAIGMLSLPDRPTGMAVTPDGARLALGDRSGKVQIWDTRTRQTRVAFSGARPLTNVISIDFSPDGRRVAVVGAQTR